MAKRFQIDQVTLTNYRGFENLTLPLESDLTVLIGDNGAGKSSVLRALATLVAAVFSPAPLQLDGKLDPTRVDRPGELTWGLKTRLMYPCGIRAHGRMFGEQLEWERGLLGPELRSTTSEVKQLRRLGAAAYGSESEPLPLWLWLGTARLWGRTRVVQTKRPDGVQRNSGWIDALDPRASENSAIQIWFWAWLKGEHSEDSSWIEAIDQALRATLLCPGSRRPDARLVRSRFDPTNWLPVLEFDDGSVLYWEQLSDGVHVFCAMVVDIARRILVLNGGVLRDPLRKTEGLVLIDEVDLHLHPNWQRRVARSLCDAFPSLQFVLTTHSALVLSSLENRHVRSLSHFGLVETPLFFEGRDANAVLGQMGVPIRSDTGQELIANISMAFQNRDRERAAQLLHEAAGRWGETDPELVRLQNWFAWELGEE